ncbi:MULTISPECIES: cation:dicarboxylate symporter family transporter [Chryseobacterium]|uniref:Aerobic C4-dicarboxylate transport protein n=1 Tax=Chryseobacterium rhizosphaerae TaxID=395937 RepID=A0AAE4C384_9FLAO|nr:MULTISPECIES: cation:dicarboxylase symporter family transporter [Chryseobacterium]MDC8098560.1 cation:dicarboxylase symporter family transporter [Chryseobacterium rhizosphaerae]MDR6527328.1 aerobic C4-dicarboxylate transport protein [Chryseobacterium rhizosphaerae]MDR6547234.1 aerobic C4-dicarboxylate transport protein [Chryseobacterium rhizosphaerae]
MNLLQSQKTFTGRYLKNLTLYVFTAIIGGVLIGHYAPEISIKLGVVSRYFFIILETIILPIIFMAIMYGICQLSDIKNATRIVWQTILYFLVISSIAIVLGFIFGSIMQPGADTGINTSKINTSLPKTFEIKDGKLSTILYLNRHGLFLILSIVLGISMNLSKGRDRFLKLLDQGLGIFYTFIKYLYLVLPIIIFCNIAYGVAIYGINTLLPLSKVVATVYLADIVFIFGILGLISYLFKFNLLKFLLNIKEEIILVITTSTSKTAFPLIFEKMESEGYSRKILRFIIPLGYNFNLAGACIYISVTCCFLVQFYNISLTINDYIWLFIIISFTSKTASGVPGSGFLALIFTLNRFGKIPLTDLALLYSVDRFMNEARSVTNFIGIAVAGAIISKFNQQQKKNSTMISTD